MRDLIVACLPDEFNLQQDLDCRAVFKVVVKIVETFGDVKKELKYLRQQGALSEEI